MRTTTTTTGRLIALGGGLVLVAALFLPWFEHREIGEGIPNFVRDLFFWDSSATVFDWDLRLMLFAVVLVLLAALVVAGQVIGVRLSGVGDTTAVQLAFLLAGIGTVLILVKLVIGQDDPSGAELQAILDAYGLTLEDLDLEIE